jgi:type III restriction enzyme
MADALIENPILNSPFLALNLIIEVTGEKKKEKPAKVMAARTLWVPAVNNHGAFGRWAFLEITDPYDVLEPIRSLIRQQSVISL